MSHLRDIQKLRHTRNINSQYEQRFSQPSQPDYVNVNPSYDRINVNDPESARTFTSKFVGTATGSSTARDSGRGRDTVGGPTTANESYDKKYHRRGQSNGMTYSQKRQADLVSPGLTIYNLSMKLNQKTANTVNPMSTRREKPQSNTDVQLPSQMLQKQPKKPQKTDKQRLTIKQQTTISTSQLAKQQKISKTSLTILYPIGKGGFGKVWKVEYKKTHQVIAMKQMKKSKIIQKKSINSVMNERMLLAKLKHPFIINMVAAFQDRENLYLLMDYIDGGDLRYHIGKRRRFNQKQTKFFLANMIIGLQYLHKNKIIHRDMKPQNMVFDSEGYLRITDLGISRQYKEDNHQDTSGTPGYMSPEVICRKNHSYAVDYFAVGVMGYQFMLGRRPYIGKNRKQIRDQILSKQAQIKPEELPQKWSTQSLDFINKLLQRNPSNRLGHTGIEQLKTHPWMSSIDWRKLAKKEIQAPYVPMSIEDNYDDYKEQISEDSVDENQEEMLLMLRDREVQSLFDQYYFERGDDNAGGAIGGRKNAGRGTQSTSSYCNQNMTSPISTNINSSNTSSMALHSNSYLQSQAQSQPQSSSKPTMAPNTKLNINFLGNVGVTGSYSSSGNNNGNNGGAGGNNFTYNYNNYNSSNFS